MACLILDTSTDLCLIGLTRNDRVLAEKAFPHLNQLSQNLIPSIQSLLQSQELCPSDLNLIALGVGPGSYTGTRVGAAVAKGLAFGLGIPIKPFCSPLAFLPEQQGEFAFLIPTRRGAYFVLQGVCNEGSTIKKAARLLSKEALPAEIGPVDFLICSPSQELPFEMIHRFAPSVNFGALARYLSQAEAFDPESIAMEYFHTP